VRVLLGRDECACLPPICGGVARHTLFTDYFAARISPLLHLNTSSVSECLASRTSLVSASGPLGRHVAFDPLPYSLSVRELSYPRQCCHSSWSGQMSSSESDDDTSGALRLRPRSPPTAAPRAGDFVHLRTKHACSTSTSTSTSAALSSPSSLLLSPLQPPPPLLSPLLRPPLSLPLPIHHAPSPLPDAPISPPTDGASNAAHSRHRTNDAAANLQRRSAGAQRV
jgi:hypothetical protein